MTVVIIGRFNFNYAIMGKGETTKLFKWAIWQLEVENNVALQSIHTYQT